jgi:hypothetical protein
MKTLNLILTLILSLTISLSLFAHSDNDPNANIAFEAAIQPTSTDALIFRCVNRAYDELLVKVYDESGSLIHSKTIHTRGNIKLTYNTADLPSGCFCVKVFNKRKTVFNKKFNITTDKDVYVVLD